MKAEEKQYAAYLYNYLQRDGIPMATREAEIMATVKTWLKGIAEEEDTPNKEEDND